MEKLNLTEDLKELNEQELKVISGGSDLFFSMGKGLHKIYCSVRDWAISYEGDPFIRRKMGGL